MIAIQFIPSFFTCRINPKFGRTKRVTSICAALRYKRIFPVSLSQAHSCILPAITVAGKNLCVSGMCAIVRFLIRRRAAVENGCGRRFPGEKLLGYQGELLLPCHAGDGQKEAALVLDNNSVVRKCEISVFAPLHQVVV